MKVSNQLMILVSRAAFDSAGHINASRVHLQDGFTNITRVQATSQDDGNIKLSLLDNIPRGGDAGATMLACNLGIQQHGRNSHIHRTKQPKLQLESLQVINAADTLSEPEGNGWWLKVMPVVRIGAMQLGDIQTNGLHNVRQLSGIRSNEDTHDLHFTRQPFPQCLGMGDGERSRGRRIEIEANGLDAD